MADPLVHSVCLVDGLPVLQFYYWGTFLWKGCVRVREDFFMLTKPKQIPPQSKCLEVLAWLAHSIGS